MRLAKPCAVCGDVVEFIIPDSPQWISVEDRLPEEQYVNIVFYEEKSKDIYIGYYNTGDYTHNKFWHSSGRLFVNTVTHWIPLPEPPKETTA